MPRVIEILRRMSSTIRTIVGMPDYRRYLDHCRLRHPGERVLSPSEYYAEFVTRRYGNGPSRCC